MAAIGVGKVIYDVLAEAATNSTPRKKTVLESNFERLRVELHVRTERKIAILGQPGAGKSSLLKGMTGGAVKPLPVIGTQTDATNWSEDPHCVLLSFYEEFVFVDVPGYDTASHSANAFLASFPFDQFDAFILVLNGKLHAADESIYQRIAERGKKICLARSFSDSFLNKSERSAAENDLRKKLSIPESAHIVFFSNKSGEGVAEVWLSC